MRNVKNINLLSATDIGKAVLLLKGAGGSEAIDFLVVPDRGYGYLSDDFGLM